MIEPSLPPETSGQARADPAGDSPSATNGQVAPPVIPPQGTLFTPEHAADLVWGYDQGEKGAFAQYAGKNVAILHKQVVGADPDWGKVREEVALKYGVDPERVVVIWIHEPNFVDVRERE